MKRPLILALCLLAGGCRCEDDPAAAAPEAGVAPESPEARDMAETRPIDLIGELHDCEIRHRGISLDLGTRADKPVQNFSVGPHEDVTDVERGGATFVRTRSRKLSYDFWLDEPISGLFVSARVHGGHARRLSIALDDRRLGVVKLPENETRIVSVSPLESELASGRHRVVLTFHGTKLPPDAAWGELDWIRIGVKDDLTQSYAAPTREDIVSDVAIADQPRRSIVLRAPSTVRCPMRLSQDAKLKLSLGFWGAGPGTAEVRIVSDDKPPVKVAERRIGGGEAASWLPLELDLGAHASGMVALELSALDAPRGGRVVFGDPTIVRASPQSPRIPEAETVVIVMLSALQRRHVPPWGPTGGLTAVGELARQGVAFSTYRVPSTVVAATVASMLTGLPPRSHTLEDPAARLPASVRTVSEMLKEAGIRTAMFTGAPTTFAAFGFDVGWDEYRAFSPVKDVSATEPLLEGAKWLERAIEEDGAPRRLLFVHARGAHPPWDVPKEDVAKLPPAEYGGALDARRGGITLANLRARRKRAQRRMEDQDWVRLRALESAALARQNAGIERIVEVLEKKGAYDDALIVVVGDVAPGEPPDVPFEPAAPLGEDRLLVPLIVKFPHARYAGKEVGAATTSVDIAFTLLEALRVDVPRAGGWLDLFQLAAGIEPLTGRAQVATVGDSYSTRVGALLLSGQFGRNPALCRLDVDPACLGDVLAKMPIAARGLWHWTYDFESEAREMRRAEREPASVDADTVAALTVWGDL